ncbi:hypothetical protein [Polynucleobacter sp. Tro8-14-1]|jgi:hypothetical protein|uniref:hypothetical protein n=1 Tax=Polynucleobacter sp. Tro8-14-1 TaxID=1758383 RepID=UPI001C0CE99A|nr:hypothetical protein [Polynucleobacter sp. Tro8-14-1]MBU3564187.1 hypothetical protein [Polynucleobacter sp. Tro8-14-1]
MIKAVVKFFGAEQDQFGMPVPYHSYLVVSSPWEMLGSGIASVVPLSENAPLSKPHFPVLQGGERAALDVALQALSHEPKNIGLKLLFHEG